MHHFDPNLYITFTTCNVNQYISGLRFRNFKRRLGIYLNRYRFTHTKNRLGNMLNNLT